jgi:hypothetical protein
VSFSSLNTSHVIFFAYLACMLPLILLALWVVLGMLCNPWDSLGTRQCNLVGRLHIVKPIDSFWRKLWGLSCRCNPCSSHRPVDHSINHCLNLRFNYSLDQNFHFMLVVSQTNISLDLFCKNSHAFWTCHIARCAYSPNKEQILYVLLPRLDKGYISGECRS